MTTAESVMSLLLKKATLQLLHSDFRNRDIPLRTTCRSIARMNRSQDLSKMPQESAALAGRSRDVAKKTFACRFHHIEYLNRSDARFSTLKVIVEKGKR